MSKPLTENQKRVIREKYRTVNVKKLAKELSSEPGEIKAYIEQLQSELDKTRKRIFTFIIILLPVLFIVFLELGLRVFKFGGDLSLFILAPEDVSDYMMCNPNVGRRYFFIQKTTPKPTKDLFLKKKPSNSYRIFVVGESTAAGFPYGNNVTFSRILNYRLSDTFPDKRIEIVNVAMSAICSYTLLDFVDEILENEPDAILIYAGHNEFYGALGVASVESLGKMRGFVKTYLKLKRFKTFLLVRNLIGQIRKLFSKTIYGGTEADPTDTLMERIVAEQSIPLDSPLYKLGEYQFENNLNEILEKFRQSNVPVLISELVSNVRDQRPFMSEETDSLPPADQVFQIAQSYKEQHKYIEANIYYYRAKDLDALRFRATERFNDIIRRTAVKWSFPVVPMIKYFQEASPNGLIGDNLMVDHLHPNINGYFLMAEAFFNTMHEKQFISANWDTNLFKSSAEYLNNWGLTEIDTVHADLTIRFLKGGWPFQPKSLPNRVLDDFTPKTKADSVSLEVLFNKSENIAVGHLRMGEYYQSKKQYDQAFREYRAAFYTVPFETMFYERAVNMLLLQQKYDQALPILVKSLQIKETPYANKWIGQILLTKYRFGEAIPYLEKIIAVEKNDPQLLYNLCRAYVLTLQKEKAEKLFKYIEQKFPNTKYHQNLALLIKNTNFSDVNKYLDRAKILMGQNQLDLALDILYESLKVQVTETAYKWIGQILLSKAKVRDAISYLEKAQEMNPADPGVLYNLSGAYTLLSEYQKARETLDTLYKYNPNFEDPSNLKERLDKMIIH